MVTVLALAHATAHAPVTDRRSADCWWQEMWAQQHSSAQAGAGDPVSQAGPRHHYTLYNTPHYYTTPLGLGWHMHFSDRVVPTSQHSPEV